MSKTPNIPEIPTHWHHCVPRLAYEADAHVREYPPTARRINILKELASILPMNHGEDRYVALANWLDEGRTSGLLTRSEYWDLRDFLAGWL